MLKFGKYRRVRRNNNTVAPSALRWSDPASWGGTKPQAGDNVTIPVGTVYLLDENTADLGLLTINGTLKVDPLAANVTLLAKGILGGSTGRFAAGSASTPHPGKVTIRLNGVRPTGVIVGPTHTPSNVSAGNPNDSFMGVAGLSRGIVWQDGFQWEVYSALPSATHRTKLSAHASASATNLNVADDITGWPSGADVIVSPTGFYGNQNTEKSTLSGAPSGFSLTLAAGLVKAKWGLLQYLRDDGISLTPGTFSTMQADPSVSNVLDERAKVILLSRNFVIEGALDAEWTNRRFGVHLMVMGLSSMFIMEGVEIRNCGQGGLLGRYPIHWHMLSYNPADGTVLGNADTTRHRVKNCSVWNSANRAFTIHGTRGVELRNNVAYDIKGHALFLEDGSEEDNIIVGNWIGRVRPPQDGETPLSTVAISTGSSTFNKVAHGLANGVNVRFDSTAPGGFSTYAYFGPSSASYWVVNAAADTFQLAASPGGSPITATSGGNFLVARNWCIKLHDNQCSAFWITNANNEIRDNSAFDSQFFGFWNAFSQTRTPEGLPGGCFGLSSHVAIHPFYTQPRKDGAGNPLYDNNESHSNGVYGSQLQFAVSDEQGNTPDGGGIINSEGNGPHFKVPANPSGSDFGVNGTFSRFFLWKNQQGGYNNRVVNPIYQRWVQADNLGTDFFGATMEGHGNKCRATVIGFSLNTETAPPGTPPQRNAFASYHSSLDFEDIVAYNYPLGTPFVNPFQQYLLMAGGVMQTWDFYTNPVETGTARHTNWRLFNSVPIYRTPPPNIINDLWDPYDGDQQMDTNGWIRRWTLAGALYDHTGALGTSGQQYIIFNHPYLTTGLSSSTTPSPAALMVRYTPDHFYGMFPKGDDSGDVGFNSYTKQMSWQRLDSSLNPIAGAVWDIEDSTTSSALPNMRHAAVPRGGYVKFNLVTGIQSSLIHHQIYNCKAKSGVNDTIDDFFYYVFDWRGSVPARVTACVGNVSAPTWLPPAGDYTVGRAKDYASVASLAALQASAGLTFWQDTANNRIVIKLASHTHNSFYASSTYYDNPRTFDLLVVPA